MTCAAKALVGYAWFVKKTTVAEAGRLGGLKGGKAKAEAARRNGLKRKAKESQ
jgi:hypothetical protein